MSERRSSPKGGKKLRRCIPKNLTKRALNGWSNKVKKGQLHKKNGPKSRPYIPPGIRERDLKYKPDKV